MKPLPKTEREMPLRFEDVIEPLVDFVIKRWDGADDFKPKRFDEIKENFMGEYIEEDISDFEGYDDTTASDGCFPEKVTLGAVVIEDVDHDKIPLVTLFGALVAYGFHIRKNFEKAKADKFYEFITHNTEIIPVEEKLKILRMYEKINRGYQ